MAKLIFGMMQSLDGYVAGVMGGPDLPMPGPALHRYFNDHVSGSAGIIYGRRMYEVMRYWDEDQADWGEIGRNFAAAWRTTPKWVVSRSLKTVGPNATLIHSDVEAFVRRLRAEIDGNIDIAGPELAASLAELDLVDEYHLFVRPYVLGRGKPYFFRARPPLRLLGSDIVPEDAVRMMFAVT